MRLAAALLLCLATTAGAQIVGEIEQTYGPFEPGPRERSPAIAVAPHGMLLAWSEVDPATGLSAIHTGLLNFDAQLVGPIHKLPAPRDQYATTPAVATDGTNFFVAWLERHRYSFNARRVGGALTDGTGAAITPRIGLGDAVPGAPALIWTGVDYRIFGEDTYSVSPQGAVTINHRGYTQNRVPFATPDANGWVDWGNEPGRPRLCWFGCSQPRPPAYILAYSILSHAWIRDGVIREDGYTSGAPAVSASGDDLLIVWSTPNGLEAARVEDGETIRYFELRDHRARESNPSLAGSLVVFDHDGDVFGSVITGDTFGEVFPISDSGEDDSEARVYRVGDLRYLVTYVREGEGHNVSLAGRFVEVRRPHIF